MPAAGTEEDVAFAGLAEQARMVRDREISPTELVEISLRRIERLEPKLNAFRIVLAERALAEAKQAEGRLAEGGDRPLLGVPIALKDSVDLTGELTANGTDAYPEPAKADSEMVRRLRAAGAIVVGKTHLPELAVCGFTESATWGVSRNPWNTDRSPGGSSGGSAAAVAAGMVPVASASDGMGSIRIPAASCGVFGLKPQGGRISIAPDAEHWHGLSVNGCEARRVIDTALYLDVTAGGSGEAGAPGPPSRSFAEAAGRAPGKLRIAWSTKPLRVVAPPQVSDEVKAAVAGTAELLSSLGHDVAPRDPAWGAVGNNVTPRYLRGVLDEVREAPRPQALERRTRGFARLGSLIPERELRRARAAEATDRERIGAIFDDFDVLMMPVMARTAVPVRRWEGRGALWTLMSMSRVYPYCAPWNHLGNPAAAVPAGFGADGLPLSVQLIGRTADEETLLSLAAQIEAERPWADARPPVS